MITSSKLQNYLLNQANGTDVKYRVMLIDNIDQLLDGSPCRKGQKSTTTHRPVVGTTHRTYTTTHQSPTSQHTTNKSPFGQHTTHKPTVTSSGDEIDHREGVYFTPPHKSSPHNYPDGPPYWHHPEDLGLPQTHKTFQSPEAHFHSTTFEAKIPPASFHHQHWPQEQKSQKPQPSEESTYQMTHPKSSAEEKLFKSSSEKPHSDLSEGETHNKPSMVSKPSLHQISRKLPNYDYFPSNILELH